MLTAAMKRYRDALVGGSYLTITHATASARPEELEIVSDLFNRTGTPLVYRDAGQVARFFADWPVLEPGIVYGPLCNGATSVMYEGAPDYPHKGVWWETIERKTDSNEKERKTEKSIREVGGLVRELENRNKKDWK